MSHAPHQPPVVNWRTHLSLLLLALVYVFSFIDRTVIAILIEPIKAEFGVSDTLMGFLSGLAFALLYAVMGIPLGRLADSGFSRRNMVAICCGLWSFATMACGMAAQFWQLVLARMTVAVGEAGGMAPSISMLSDLYPKSRRSLAISLYLMGPHVGLLLAMALGGWIAQQYGWRATFLAFGIPGMVLALLLWLLVREPRRGAFDEIPASAPAAAPRLGMIAQVRDLLAIRAFRYVCLGCAMAGVAGYGYGIWAPSFLVRAHAMPLAHAGLVFGLIGGISAALGSVFCGWLCDRLTRRDERWQIGLPTLGVLASIPAGIAFVLWPAAGTWSVGSVQVPHAMLLAGIFSFFASWSAPLAYAAVSHMMAASQRAVGAALLNLFMTVLGAGCGPFLTGFLSDVFTARFGAAGLAYALAVTVATLGVTAVLFWMAVQPYRTRLAQVAAHPA